MSDNEVKDFTRSNVRDFTPERKALVFRVDNDVFSAVAALPALLAMEFASSSEEFEKASATERVVLLRSMFNLILVDDSVERFFERLSSKTDPIDTQTMFNIIDWLMEEYGQRPTESPSGSSNGLETQESGSNLMVTAPVTELTSAVSL
jgi:hypothetical protein